MISSRSITTLVVFLVALVTLAGCATDGGSEPSSEGSSAAVSVARTLHLSLPANAKLHELAVVASSSITLGSNASVSGGGTSLSTIASVGMSSTDLGSSASVGNLWSRGQVRLGSSSRVNGYINTSAGVTQGAGATVGGPVNTDVEMSPIQPFEWSVDYPSSTQDVSVATNASLTLSPGAYRSLTVFPRGNLKLTSGTYYIDSLRLMATSNVVADTSSGAPLFLYVGTTADLGAAITAPAGARSDLFLLGYFGSGGLTITPPFAGTVVAPNATLTFGTGVARGSFFASQVRFNSSASLAFESFAAWDFIFPPKAIMNCVTHFDGTHSTTLWGYENPLDIAVHIPVGERNQVTPADGRLITDFAPGRHEKVFMTFFGSTQDTWTLGGADFTSDAFASHRCIPSDLPAMSPDQLITLNIPAGTSPPQSQLALNVTNNVGPGAAVEDSFPSRTPAGSGPPPAPPPSKFRFIIDGQDLDGDDAACGPRQLSVNVFIDGTNDDGRPRNLPGCTNPGACGVPIPDERYERTIPNGQAEVVVTVHIDERDDPACGGDDDKILDATLRFNALTGKMTGGSMNSYDSDDHPQGSIFLPPETNHIVGRDDFGIYFSVEVDVPVNPRICGKWRANFIDSGGPPGAPTEDFLTSSSPEPVDASFARARLFVRPTSTSVPFVWVGTLDKDGCVPANEAPSYNLFRESPTLVVRLDLYSFVQACLDQPDGLCPPTITDNDGARIKVSMAEKPTKGGGVPMHTWRSCAAVDPASSQTGCQRLDGLPGWVRGNPPARIDLMNDSVFEVSRTMAVMSHMLKQEATGNNLGIRSALMPPGDAPHLAEVHLREAPCYNPLPSQPNFPQCADVNSDDEIQRCVDRGQCDTSAGYDTLLIAGDKYDSDGNTVPGDYNWKFTIAHEFGHILQHLTSGYLPGGYDGEVVFDPARDLPPKCACNHVTGANQLHCLQSLEGPGASQREGWAQFFASRVWNRPSERDCTFKYYKAFLTDASPTGGSPIPGVPDDACSPAGDNLVSCKPPIPVNCLTPVRWRNNQCFDSSVTADQAVTLNGTEYDWMGFYYGLSTDLTTPVSIDDFAGIYRTACGGPCGSKQITWDGTCSLSSCFFGSASLEGAAEDFLTLEKFDVFDPAGDRYGVSRRTDR